MLTKTVLFSIKKGKVREQLPRKVDKRAALAVLTVIFHSTMLLLTVYKNNPEFNFSIVSLITYYLRR